MSAVAAVAIAIGLDSSREEGPMSHPRLSWLRRPDPFDWRDYEKQALPPAWSRLVALANHDLDFLETSRLARALRKPDDDRPRALRVAILASSTADHLLPGLQVGALRRGLNLETYVAPYGQYVQELKDPSSGLHRFHPQAVLIALDAEHLATLASSGREREAVDMLCGLWAAARSSFDCQVIQQLVLPTFPSLMGSNEHRLHDSSERLCFELNHRIRERASYGTADLLAIDQRAARDGLDAWYDPVLWLRAKQEIRPTASPMYGEMVARLLAAQLGRSAKCLVLDLDNTLWGGVIGDAGLDGIVLGQGSALGEAFVSFQKFAQGLSRRGVILAVCSKNDEVNALAPFEQHPEMILRRSNISCFVANWQDKVANLRVIAETLDIGIDSLVFVDDNPFERNIVRRELPAVAVPELPEDPALFARCLADAGYFEALEITKEDAERTQQYQMNQRRAELRSSSTDLIGYLKSLGMRLEWQPFDRLSHARVTQLINKTNQFNLMTRRYTSAEVLQLIDSTHAIGLQFRLVDTFGDNGIIGIAICDLRNSPEVTIDTWLMSCRVLGRGVEEAMLNVIAGEARRRGASHLIGCYRATAKNAMVKDHYPKLGFEPLDGGGSEVAKWGLELAAFSPIEICIEIAELSHA